jgi:37-kD nucleoid-associated bacterial protein
MSLRIRFNFATASGIVLAKVGNPQREEPLTTSKEVFRVDEKDQVELTALLLKPFKNLIGHRFYHHSSLDKHEMNACAKAMFAKPEELLERGIEIAKRLYSKSNHPNIKAGDLCIALIDDVEVDDEKRRAICILKSETMVPFLSISARDGDLQLSTEQGINPEKIDKGCLIINHNENKGYYVLTFDRSGGDTRFWVREFLGVQAVTDSAFLTKSYADMAVAFVAENKTENADDTPPWESCAAAKDALDYFEERDEFSLEEFEDEVLKTPEAKQRFAEHRSRIEEEQGQPLETSFEISKKDLNKAKKRIGAVMKLDTGVEIHVKPSYSTQDEPVLERGFDKAKGMNWVKVFYNHELRVAKVEE